MKRSRAGSPSPCRARGRGSAADSVSCVGSWRWTMREQRDVPAGLRDAATPDLASGAAERIAAGAWERAARLRSERAPRFRVLRRGGWIAAAAVLVGVAVFALRGTDPVFAVEGEPVL